MSKLIAGILSNAAGDESPKSKRLLKRIRRDRKLYIIDVNGSVRRLDKLSTNLYDSIIVNFLMGDAEKRYQKLNKDAKHWTKIKPITLEILKQFEDEVKAIQKLTKQKFPTVYYNGSWKPLVQMVTAKK